MSKIHLKEEHLIVAIIALQSLYYAIANLYDGVLILYFACYMCGVFAYFLLLRRKPAIFATIIFVLLFAILYAVMINEGLWDFVFDGSSLYAFSTSKLTLLLFVHLPVLLLCLTKKLDYDCLVNAFYKWALPLLVLDILVVIVRIQRGINQLDYMTIAYQLLLWTAFCVIGAVKNQKKWPFFLVAVSSLLIITGGSRGAFICLICLFIMLYARWTFFGGHDGASKKLGVHAFLIILCLLLVINFNTIIEYLLTNVQIGSNNSRVLTMIQNEELLVSGDRLSIADEILPHLFDHIFGFGIFGDRFITNNEYYAHNLVLEILVQFGIVGLLICIYLVVLIVKSIKIVHRQQMLSAQLLLALSLMLIVKYMFSGSYLLSSEIMLSIGIMYNISTKSFDNS